MDRINAMRLFVRAAETGSFSATAREADQPQSNVSKQIAALERHLGVRLLARTTRRLTLTEEGARFFEQARRIVHEVTELEAATRKAGSGLSGRIRLGGAVGFGRSILLPKLKAFLAAHPGLSIEFRQSDELTNLVAEGLDLTIRIGELRDSALVARPLGITHRCAMASAEYLAGAPPLQLPADLARHNCILYTGVTRPDLWHFEGPEGPSSVRVQGNLHCSNSEGVRAAVLAGMGVSYSPDWLYLEELESGAVRRLFPGHTGRVVPVHAVYAAGRAQPLRVRRLVDFLEAEFARDPYVSKSGAHPGAPAVARPGSSVPAGRTRRTARPVRAAAAAR
ncbi:MAG TPA: LysR family transcriptional regulator [Burkholderiales bacterium]|nr:LysR family transcriptional regulator [Burkholderiales bacterium]